MSIVEVNHCLGHTFKEQQGETIKVKMNICELTIG